MSRPTIALIFNPAARGDKAARFRKWLGQLPADVALLETFAPGSATGLARQAVKDGFRTVVASGGDGTINEVVNGLGQAPRALGQVRLGMAKHWHPCPCVAIPGQVWPSMAIVGHI